MDYKYIEQLLERYFDGVSTLEEESILRTFFSQKDIPAELAQWQPLFADDNGNETLGDDFDARILAMIGSETDNEPVVVTARRVTMVSRMMPLFKAAAVVAILLTVGGALQAPWNKSWATTDDYAAMQSAADTVAAIQPIQAENLSDAADSTFAPAVVLPQN